MRTRGVDAALLRSGDALSVTDGEATLDFIPTVAERRAALVFLCGAGVSAQAYVPLLHPIALAGYPVFIVKLPYRIAPLEAHKEEAIRRTRTVIERHPEIQRWVVAGHSLGGALAARLANSDPTFTSALVLIGTTHPKQDDLSRLTSPVTKVYATNDGVAPAAQVLANKRLLPAHTKWVVIDGGNHSQFGHYGHQLFDGTATVSRDEQQAVTRGALLESLRQSAQ